MPLSAPPLGLYVHIPWCVRKCPYCDFNSHASAESLPEAAYVDALLADLDLDAPRIGSRGLETVFIGGGTPSLFSPAAIARLLTGISERLACAPDMEVTLEANPGTLETGKFEGFRLAGVNRLSIGVQSFDNAGLEQLGRIHGADAAIAAAHQAKACGFERLNLDLMFGLPGQSLGNALADINTAIALQPSHLSFYQLTLEPNTLFHEHPPSLPEDERIWEMQQACRQALISAGFDQYEVSAWARNGDHCRHNLNYWQFGDYLGIGAGAHGKLTDPATGRISRYWRIKHPRTYLAAAGATGTVGGESAVSEAELPFEFLMNHLRLRAGFTLPLFEARTGLSVECLDEPLRQCIGEGLLEQDGNRIYCTDRGWNFLDNVLEMLM
ncbi:radical SAM family heme chaperone HemW [Candidatus Methylospira mobilis]|uniref:radical SAM family heme chaperone HemW n=1 Tax=Candidatus Methylospira mobilis TaxID=1808979 RepID=UPI0028EBBF62|nr:radical SAM family heme chaperone HemW [Candidatus Methylospira mobilis]WNV06634.1 radical SAM family heme chaperone HemW [Candidatus Methylospira mobilis]